ncbi:class F sortase [Priestia sp. Y58]|uniref:class F sortase n=1 Tax=Priestia TaxID=2800373 RepID=UPI0021ADC494|nr:MULTISPECIES: class F sortase [Priestia]MCZ8495870.1 class F sortase [Priestia megaterium]MDG0029275.1 class F sortase [Priestia sp. Y58]MDG0058942.1 class F sortase [Priestia sp. P5]UYV50893.1 class F sortase [Priestia megaterium]
MIGGKGNAVLAGHVDSKTGPAVFYNLKNLKKDDEITVRDAQGTTLTFVVKRIKRIQAEHLSILAAFRNLSEKALLTPTHLKLVTM